MKRSLVLLGVVVLVAGCGGGGNKSSSGTTAKNGSNMKIGLVTDVGGLNDRGFNHLSYVGLLRAQKELGVQQRVYQANSTQQYVPNLSTFARQRYNLTIGVGFTEAEAIDTAAHNFPNSKFAIVDVDQTTEQHKPANLLGLLFREQETGYLVGYLAGLEAKRLPGPDVIGSVGGQKQPPVDRFIAGYQAGARAADPGIKTLNGYSEDFADQAILGPHILTSAVKRVDTAVFLAIKSVVDGNFKGGNMIFGLKENGVGIGKISPKVPRSEVAAVNKVRADIISGKIKNIPTVVK